MLAWQSVVFGKAIYGVPASYPLFLWVHWVHGELMDKDGLQPPKNLGDYTALLKHFTNPQQDFYGLATENNVGYGITNGFITAMYGLPNNWGLNNGKLTYYLEDPRTIEATSKARELYAAGVYSPNSTQYNTGSKRTDFAGRKFSFNFDGFQGASLTFFSTAAGLNPGSGASLVQRRVRLLGAARLGVTSARIDDSAIESTWWLWGSPPAPGCLVYSPP